MQQMTMNKVQLENLVIENIERIKDDRGLATWLPEVTADVRSVEVGVWRCPSGEIACADGLCNDECGCCDHSALWESPLGSEPECHCGRTAFLVEVVGRIDYSACLS